MFDYPGFYWYRQRDMELRKFFASDATNSLMYCQNVEGLINALGLGYNSHEWRLFIDSSTKSLKAVLLHIGNKMPLIPLAHSTFSYPRTTKQ